MGDASSGPRIRVDVFHCRVRRFVLGEPDYQKWPVDDLGIMLAPEGRPQPGGGDNIPLGTVEVPGDADVDSLSVVRINRPFDSRRNDPGVPIASDGNGVRYFVYANQILDIASAPEHYSGLGITLVADKRSDRPDA
jgi:hypothetical protein